MVIECEGEDCSYDAKFDVYYEDDLGSSEGDIISAFIVFFNNTAMLDFKDTGITATASTSTSLSKSTDADITAADEASKNLSIILPIGFVCIVAFALAFVVVRRRSSVRSSLDHEEASLVSRNSSAVGEDTTIFPVSSNGLNNEFEVDSVLDGYVVRNC
jgi:hypothetical protein